MSLSSFSINSRTVFVADASVVINLNATARASDIIKTLPTPLIVTENAFAELISGIRNGHDDAKKLQTLIDEGIVQLAYLGELGKRIYTSLVEGATLRTLDDGEAATIAYACETNGIAAIDERKARTICARRFPELQIVSTIDLLTHEVVARELGHNGQIEAIVTALQEARMRVPTDQISKVVTLIGKKHAASCNSLPRTARILM